MAETPYMRLDALAEFHEWRPHRLFALIENVFLQQSFIWPLLIMGDVSCALPALVTVILDRDLPRFPTGEFVVIYDGDHTNSQDWKHSLEKARIAAIELWETKHASDDPEFQELVRHSRAILDLRIASMIVAPHAHLPFKLEGESLEVYVGLEILRQLLGRRSLGSTCATGEIDIASRHVNGTGSSVEKKGAFYGIKTVNGLDKKVEWARRAFYFDRTLVPRDKCVPPSQDHLHVIPIDGAIDDQSFGRSDRGFSGFATEAMGQSWRRHRYVRCPDIAREFRREAGGKPSEEAAAIRHRIGQAPQSIVRLSNFSPADVAHGLYWVNRTAEKNAHPDFTELAGNERLGRFAFVRATPDESHERLWRVIWETCEGSETGFRRFVLATTVRAAAEELAQLLNGAWAETDHRNAVPDALVIFGTKHLMEDGPPPLKTHPFGAFRLDYIVNELLARKLLKPCVNPALRARLGLTRLILVDKDDSPSEDWIDVPDPRVREALQQLSIFRHGFTEAVARIHLGIGDSEFDEVMGALKSRDEWRSPLVRFAENAQEYYIPSKMPMPEHRGELARLHLRAANSIVGILDRTRRPAHHDFGSALRADRLHEAQWHTEQGVRLLPPPRAGESASTERRRAVDARERLRRIGEPFTWSHLRWVTLHSRQAGEDLWRAARSAMSEAGPSGVHPVQLAWLAKLVRKLERQNPGSARRWVAERERLIGQALDLCSSLQGRDAVAAEFVVRTTRAVFTMEEMRNARGYASAGDDNRRAWQLYDEFFSQRAAGSLEIIDNLWFEQCGDGERDVEAALDCYRSGFFNKRLRGAHELNLGALVKWLACLHQLGGGLRRSEWRNLLSALHENDWQTIRDWVVPRTGLTGLGSARHRWREGRQVLLEASF